MVGNDKLKDRFGVFGMMPDGSLVAFWRDTDNEQKIIVLGSEGDSQLILATSFLNFIRLIAIGYHDLSYTDFGISIKEHNRINEMDENYGVNSEFHNWFIENYHTTIPTKGIEIINIEDDSFAKWIDEQLQ